MSEWKEYRLGDLSAERSYIYSPPQRGGCDDNTRPNRQPAGLQPNLHSYRVAALQAAFGRLYTETPPRCGGLYLLRHSVPRQSLKGSNRYSVWQRHTTYGIYHSQQPVGLRHIRFVPCVVAALQAALVGRCCYGTAGRCPGLYLLQPYRLQ